MGVTLNVDAYRRAAAQFGETVASLTDDEWARPTFPNDWTAVTSTAWLVAGDAQLASAARGDGIAPLVEFDSAVLGPNPVASWRGTALSVLRALDGVDLTQMVSHPQGTIRLGDVVAQRVSENLIRAFDIGRAVGRPIELPAELAEACLDFWAEHGEAILRGGVFPDQPREPAAGADSVERFVALMGRDPESQP